MSESEIIAQLLEGDEEFKMIHDEHRELDEIIKNLEDKESLSLDDEVEVRRLKKIKLSLKDRMETKIHEHKSK
ncbi:MAG: YdcH family protein [Thermodesulfobacteriota bacterium]